MTAGHEPWKPRSHCTLLHKKIPSLRPGREMMEREKITLKVFRFDPTADSRPIFQEYEVERSEKMSVLSAVRQIYENLDGSLSFSGYFCYRKLCGLCQMKINGKNRLSCRTRVEDGMIIEPAPGYALIKDLAVDFSADKFKQS